MGCVYTVYNMYTLIYRFRAALAKNDDTGWKRQIRLHKVDMRFNIQEKA